MVCLRLRLRRGLVAGLGLGLGLRRGPSHGLGLQSLNSGSQDEDGLATFLVGTLCRQGRFPRKGLQWACLGLRLRPGLVAGLGLWLGLGLELGLRHG